VIKLASHRVALVLVASALALASGVVPAQAATSGWRTDVTVAVRDSVTLLTSVAASSSSDAWASGFSMKAKGTALAQTVIRHWTGKTWRPVKLPAKIARASANEALGDGEVGGSSARNVWVFGVVGSYMRLDGGRWSLGRLPGESNKSGALVLVDAVKVFSRTNVWAFGERISAAASVQAYSAHYNGHNWSQVTVPGSGLITAVAAASSHDIWAVETALSPSGLSASAAVNAAVARFAVAASPAVRSAVARWRAAGSAATSSVVLQWTSRSGWHKAAKQPNLAASDQLVSAMAEPGGHVWFGGSASNSANGTSPVTAEWNGASWSVSDLPGKASSADVQLTAMAPDGTGGIWALAVGNNIEAERIWHLQGARWSRVSPGFGKRRWALESLALVPRTHSVWGVGKVQGSSKSSADGLIAVDGRLPR
jgi:hypothetical protein